MSLRRSRPADIRLITGAPGTGKSFYGRSALRAHRGRALVWDFKDDHPNVPSLTLAQLAREVLTLERARYRPRYVELDRQFELFCRIAWAAQVHDPQTDCLVLVEECQRVTRPGSAPEAWQQIVELGRAYGFTVLAVSPRPASIDLEFRSAATFIRTGRLGDEADARAIGGRIGVPYRDLQRLPDRCAYVFDGRSTVLERPRGKAAA